MTLNFRYTRGLSSVPLKTEQTSDTFGLTLYFVLEFLKEIRRINSYGDKLQTTHASNVCILKTKYRFWTQPKTLMIWYWISPWWSCSLRFYARRVNAPSSPPVSISRPVIGWAARPLLHTSQFVGHRGEQVEKEPECCSVIFCWLQVVTRPKNTSW